MVFLECAGYSRQFMDVVVKWSGSAHDARMFVNSRLNEKLRSGTIPKCLKRVVSDEDPIPVVILGDPASPLLPYLMNKVGLLHKNNILATNCAAQEM